MSTLKGVPQQDESEYNFDSLIGKSVMIYSIFSFDKIQRIYYPITTSGLEKYSIKVKLDEDLTRHHRNQVGTRSGTRRRRRRKKIIKI